jgi:hypothetical protein
VSSGVVPEAAGCQWMMTVKHLHYLLIDRGYSTKQVVNDLFAWLKKSFPFD